METIREPHEPTMTDQNITPTMLGPENEEGTVADTALSVPVAAAKVDLDPEGTESEEDQGGRTDLTLPMEAAKVGFEPDQTEVPEDQAARTDLGTPAVA